MIVLKKVIRNRFSNRRQDILFFFSSLFLTFQTTVRPSSLFEAVQAVI